MKLWKALKAIEKGYKVRSCDNTLVWKDYDSDFYCISHNGFIKEYKALSILFDWGLDSCEINGKWTYG